MEEFVEPLRRKTLKRLYAFSCILEEFYDLYFPTDSGHRLWIG